MRGNDSPGICIYFTLLFISCSSSIFLFLLHTGNATSEQLSKNLSHDADHEVLNIILSESNSNSSKFVSSKTSDTVKLIKAKEKLKTHNHAEVHSSFGETALNSLHDSAVNTEDIPSHVEKVPSHSQSKFSDTSPSVIYNTLIDADAAEISSQVKFIPRQTESVTIHIDPNVSTVDPVPIQKGQFTDYAVPHSLKPNTSFSETVKEDQYIVRAEPKVVPSTEPVVKEDEIRREKGKTEQVPEVSVVTQNSEQTTGKSILPDPFVVPKDEPTPQEDIPSFSEWAEKHLAEAEEKKKGLNGSVPSVGTSTRPSGTTKLRSKNYASPDCGAKIVAANPEAQSASSVLSHSLDEYLLNTCTSRIWFVIELCEAIQAKKIDMANFELFSSSPKMFTVSIADRFPTRDWHNVGNFTAQDERTIQSFNLEPFLFGKFIRVELHSHYGSEHFCPISLFRVYGTSEFEVLQTVDEALDTSIDSGIAEGSDDEEPLDIETGEPTKNLFGSARDAVLSIVKKAAEALVKGGTISNESLSLNTSLNETGLNVTNIDNCKSPRHIIVCDNCSDVVFDNVYTALSCRQNDLMLLMNNSFIYRTIRDTNICLTYGFDFSSLKSGAPYPENNLPSDEIKLDPGGYITVLFSPEYVAALCNMLAILEKRLAVNTSEESQAIIPPNATIKPELKQVDQNYETMMKFPSTCTLEVTRDSSMCTSSSANEAELATPIPQINVDSGSSIPESSLINPTKTLPQAEIPEDIVELPHSKESLKNTNLSVSKTSSSDGLSSTISPSVATSTPDSNESVIVNNSTISKDKVENTTKFVPTVDLTTVINETSLEGSGDSSTEVNQELLQDQISLDSLLNELKDLEQAVNNAGSTVVPSSTASAIATAQTSVHTQQIQTESVFVRLANRIKALERNMSLSGQYLEELSRRYKKQMEEMQKTFNRTLAALADESRKGNEREQKHAEEIDSLMTQMSYLSNSVEMLMSERSNWSANVVPHLFHITIELFLFSLLVWYCRLAKGPVPDNVNQRSLRKLSVPYRKRGKTLVRRRRSVEGVSGHVAPKQRNRRPSEEALIIAGTYKELLISESFSRTEFDGGSRTVLKGENKRRRRRKKESSPVLLEVDQVVQNGVESDISRKPSSADLGKVPGTIESQGSIKRTQKQDSVPNSSRLSRSYSGIEEVNLETSECSSPVGFPATRETVSSLTEHSSLTNAKPKALEKKLSSSSVPTDEQNSGLGNSVSVKNTNSRQLPTPSFMKTAISQRKNRVNTSSESCPKLKSDNWEWYSRYSSSSEKSSLSVQSTDRNEVESRTSSSSIAVSDSGQRESSSSSKKTSGLKKIVKRFF